MNPRVLNSGQSPKRSALWRLAIVISVLALAVALAACGDSSDDSSGGGGGGADSTEASGGGGDVKSELTALLEPEAAGPLGGGETLKLGLTIPQAGQGAAFGAQMTKGSELAAEQIEMLGGPKVDLDIQNNGSGDPEAGVANMKAFNSAGVGTALTSNIANLGSQLPLASQYKILLLDPGGGTGGITAPFFWGTRTDAYFAAVPGLFKYIAETEGEDIETISFVGDSLGPETDKAQEKLLKAEAQKQGWKFGGFITNDVGETDFANVISELEQSDADVAVFGEYGRDAGFALRQMQAQGLEIPVYGYTFTSDIPPTAAGAEEGYKFAADYFSPAAATNDWATLFTETYEDKFGEEPDFFAANYYESAFVVWELARRVLAEKGDINSGEAMQKALESEPTFPSVLGGTGTELGTTEISPKTHAVVGRKMGVFEYSGGEVKPKAYFGFDAADFELVE